MTLPPDLASNASAAVEQAYALGIVAGKEEQAAEYFGKSARVLTGGLFAASLSAAAQMLRQHDVEAADFFNEKAAEFEAWVTPPRIESTEPGDGATAISFDNPINVKFVAPGVRVESVTLDNVYVTPASGGSHLAGALSYDPATCTLTFVPANPLSPDTEYKVTVGAAVQGTGGLTFGTDTTFNFTTAQAT